MSSQAIPRIYLLHIWICQISPVIWQRVLVRGDSTLTQLHDVIQLECRRPRRKRAGRGAKRPVPFGRVDAWAARQPEGRWTRLTIRAGEREPLRVDAMTVRVRTKLDRKNGPEERLVVMRTVEEKPETHYALSNAGTEVTLPELVRVRFTRHRIEEVFGAGKGEIGLGQYEVRSWVGWNRHS